MGHEVGVQQKTAWLFKRKIQVVMKQPDDDKLDGDVDETLPGGYTEGPRVMATPNMETEWTSLFG